MTGPEQLDSRVSRLSSIDAMMRFSSQALSGRTTSRLLITLQTRVASNILHGSLVVAEMGVPVSISKAGSKMMEVLEIKFLLNEC